MIDLRHSESLQRAFAGLLQDLSVTWPEQDIAYLSDEVSHREYGDALENLVALGLQNGRHFTPEQNEQIQAIASDMEIEYSSLLTDVRKRSAL